MTLKERELSSKYHLDFKIFLELMSNKVREILLVSSRYDAFIIEEDVTLASRIIHEYSGLNLSHPPRLTRTTSALQALTLLDEKQFDLVFTMPNIEDMDAFILSRKIKEKNPALPVYLLAHSLRDLQTSTEAIHYEGIDKVFIWSGNADLLLAIIKGTEDALNVDYDTTHAQVCVLIFVEDSPLYYSTLLPIFYKEVVKQIQAVLELGVNEEERLLIMRTRPKIISAQTFEEATALYEKYKPYLLGIISDTRIPKQGRLFGNAGIELLSRARQEFPHLPMLLFSSESENRARACQIPAEFLDKNSPELLKEIHDFFLTNLGFGEFVFRMPDGTEVGRANKLRMLGEKLAIIPDESLCHHIEKKDMATWIMMRSEIPLASTIRDLSCSSFSSTREMREYIISLIHMVRKWRQKGVVAKFNRKEFDIDLLDFAKIGEGSLGGKARGLAFMSSVLHEEISLFEKYQKSPIRIPQTIVLATDVFEEFVKNNNLKSFAADGYTDEEVAQAFLKAEMPSEVVKDLQIYLEQVAYPLSVRSSSLLEDAQFQPYEGLYETYMISNNHPDFSRRLESLINAVKLVYASTYYESPKAFAKSTASQAKDESMAVVIQQLVGDTHGDYYYPAISGVAQSHNYYPVSHMKHEDGIVRMAIGFGKTVVEGGKCLRFCPRYPEILPQFSTVDDMLANSQRFFYSLKIMNSYDTSRLDVDSNLEKRNIYDARTEFPIIASASTYDPEEHRIIDTGEGPGGKIITFSQILKYRSIPLPKMLSDILELSRRNMGCPVEIEFAVNLRKDNPGSCDFYLLQIRPMVTEENRFEVEISEQDRERAFCFSNLALGNGRRQDIADIIFVKQDDFRLEATYEIAAEVGRLNGALLAEKRSYLLIGPGRWGSFDRWLGIPVQWRHISGVGAIVEIRGSLIKADPSHGSHFFQNITSLGIFYVSVTEGTQDFLDWPWLESLPVVNETTHLRHVRLPKPLTIKIDGRKSQCIMFSHK
ncbi:MAG: phosphoenolpyruvate synthase/pyruvate phosphate dikinase [Deltaproteobacteria bacterium]|nr:phosphoenolpyruvate synthase/pyruvate phosphate dikinase [Deltaproteobacteria bacterium]MBN2686626.1 phosphoenolpyruvate synthase/pyruvate phosphate dikinase [Deltaproteobacteria bacterium]